ncbi:3-oxoacyl-ACP reductase FabG [Mesorhizobium sp. CO1-1-8]|uniref:3-oxoacyl-ACP reductase FabG n=1 Tax=Mesorhizobium sp. CO1-1-8 TaxID=2876631 RepID=UPI001CD150FC|nr:3-oxoacyl-ACP reductase FabG [Mesorhizobium sp. CO1-1-8]MBZ9772452.1 3-oxoacyl-ACP reductase FabG [Mesorhizobium sp. CO1-1-8]
MGNTLKGKTVIVTGASTGIGLGLSRRFAAEGAKLAMVARSADRLERVVSSLRSEGADAIAVSADVSDPASVQDMAAAVVKVFGGCDILCCNAGIYPSANIQDLTPEDWDLVNNTNSKGAFLCVKALLPYLKASKAGRIILTSSITGPVTGFPGLTHYSASKAAMLGFMRAAAVELARDGITVNAVLPGVIETEALKGLGEAFIESSKQLVPMHRLGTPEDIAEAALFFASEKSSFITGQGLVVDGGQTLPESPDCVLPPY